MKPNKGFRVYWEGFPIDEFPTWVHKPGEFLTRLVGVEISGDGKCGTGVPSALPLYIPLLRWRSQAGQILIEVNWNRPLAYITLQRKQPYLHIFTFPWWLWDEEEP